MEGGRGGRNRGREGREEGREGGREGEEERGSKETLFKGKEHKVFLK